VSTSSAGGLGGKKKFRKKGESATGREDADSEPVNSGLSQLDNAKDRGPERANGGLLCRIACSAGDGWGTVAKRDLVLFGRQRNIITDLTGRLR